jgi:predicted DNA-binding transcriptional regulator YafY
VPGLDEAELRALLMAQARVNGDGALATATESALAKLMASLPSSMRERAVSIRERLYVDPSGWRDTTENLSALPAVQRGVSDDRQVRIRYCKAGGDTQERVVDPLGLVAKGNAWYLVAGTVEGLRTFRVSRIATAEVLESPCRRPAHFDLVAHWTSSTARFDRDRGRVVVTMAVEAAAARRLLTYHAGSIVEEPAAGLPGWATVTIRFDHEDEALFVCLGLGSKVRVIEPDLLRERIEAEAVAVLQMRSVGDAAAENVDRVVHARRERDGE